MWQPVYDLCVVGAGLIGSAAARHAVTGDPTKKILLIGPSEPKDRQTADIFGAHYDEARIYRMLDPDPVWAVLGTEARQRYAEIAKESGSADPRGLAHSAQYVKQRSTVCVARSQENWEQGKTPQAIRSLKELEISIVHKKSESLLKWEGQSPTKRIGSTKVLYTQINYFPAGVKFYHERGFAKIGPDRAEVMDECRDVAKKLGLHMLELKTQESRQKFPYIAFRPGETVLITPDKSGCINPRRLLQAQQTLARKHGCEIIDDVVNSVTPAKSSGDLHQIVTGQGHLFLAKRVLLATGAFTTCRDLLPTHLWPDIVNSKHTVLLVEIHEDDYHTRLKTMPPLSIERLHPENNQDPKYWTYVIPPIRYPNGKLYIKLGHGEEDRTVARTPQEIKDWYRCRGDPIMANKLMVIWRELFPDIKAQSYRIDNCLASQTSTYRPYIDTVRPGIGIAVGGCACSAKSSDEIGRIATRLILDGKWDSELPKEEFKYRVTKKNNLPLSNL